MEPESFKGAGMGLVGSSTCGCERAARVTAGTWEVEPYVVSLRMFRWCASCSAIEKGYVTVWKIVRWHAQLVHYRQYNP